MRKCLFDPKHGTATAVPEFDLSLFAVASILR
jgi:hypothetical protein